jgi:hypothetical protein
MGKLKVTPDGIEAPKKKLQKVVVTTKKDYSLQDNKTLKKLNRTLFKKKLNELIPNDKKNVLIIYEKPKHTITGTFEIYLYQNEINNMQIFILRDNNMNYNIDDNININYFKVYRSLGHSFLIAKMLFKNLYI